MRNFVSFRVVNLIEIQQNGKYILCVAAGIIARRESQGIEVSTYDYKCRECGHAFEEYQPITADPLVVCPKCGKHTLKRVMGTGGGLIFKGSGFYQTDYKKDGSRPSASTDKKKTDTKTTEKKEGETKPAESRSAEAKSKPTEPKSGAPPKKDE
jgi:putative FmdB family regulatory protein